MASASDTFLTRFDSRVAWQRPTSARLAKATSSKNLDAALNGLCM